MIERLKIEEYDFKAFLLELTETSFTNCWVSAKFPPGVLDPIPGVVNW